jgi:hypothetical protein
MESISCLLKELEAVREASTREARAAFLAALWRRSHADIAQLSIQFANGGMKNLAAMCRTIAAAKAETR